MEFDVDLFRAVAIFMFGAAIGSFLNVVIVRLPERKSIVYPPSNCPDCGHPIRPYDNIPVVSFLFLRGRCRDCGARISWRYPLVELLTACLGLALYMKLDLTAELGVFFVFCTAMMAVFWIDLDHMIIPDVISLSGIVLGIAAATAGYVPGVDWRFSLLGAGLGGVALYVPALIYERLRGIEGLGGGDVKLLIMIGAFTGPYGVIFVMFSASLMGSIGALISMWTRRIDSTTPIPFGPFLTAAAVFYVFFGNEIIDRFFG
ncbi:MAG: prepilin peptidase [Desulfomonile tiedjei]|nr:prepilin peptidase [Desulfomonile tiedjei]